MAGQGHGRKVTLMYRRIFSRFGITGSFLCFFLGKFQELLKIVEVCFLLEGKKYPFLLILLAIMFIGRNMKLGPRKIWKVSKFSRAQMIYSLNKFEQPQYNHAGCFRKRKW